MVSNISLKNKRVVLENPIAEEQQPTKSNLILPRTKKEGNIRKSKVVATSPDCEFCQPGDTVYFSVGLRETFGGDLVQDDYIIVKESDVLIKIID